jgi:hypothetical protein
MKTQQQLLTEHRKQLDEAFAAKYPNGKFCLQRFDRANFVAIHWAPRRNTSHTSFKGISVKLDNNGAMSNHDYQRSSFGRCNYYDTFEKMLASAKRLGFDEKLIAMFVERYQNRASEGFAQ